MTRGDLTSGRSDGLGKTQTSAFRHRLLVPAIRLRRIYPALRGKSLKYQTCPKGAGKGATTDVGERAARVHFLNGEAVVLVSIGVDNEADGTGVGKHLESCEEYGYDVE